MNVRPLVTRRSAGSKSAALAEPREKPGLTSLVAPLACSRDALLVGLQQDPQYVPASCDAVFVERGKGRVELFASDRRAEIFPISIWHQT